jgi:hypothetical protein
MGGGEELRLGGHAFKFQVPTAFRVDPLHINRTRKWFCTNTKLEDTLAATLRT